MSRALMEFLYLREDFFRQFSVLSDHGSDVVILYAQLVFIAQT